MSERFYVNCPLAPGPLVLDGSEARHLTAVCRFRPGDQVTLFNGDGREYRATVNHLGRGQVDLEISESTIRQRELPFRLMVACPLPKGDRAQWLLEKLTELGVTEYVPLRTRRSVVHPGEGKAEKLRRHVIEASKQCGRNFLLAVAELISWEQLITQVDLPVRRYLGQTGGEPWPATRAAADTIVAVGPEGGWTDDEIAAGCHAGWRKIDLGPRILRVETAAVVLATLAGQPSALASSPSGTL